MPSRAIALVLALVLLWSAFATQEQIASLMNAEQPRVSAGPDLPQRLNDGSVDEHHLDDLPTQAHAETVADMQALLMNCAQAQGAEHSTTRYRPYAVPARADPYLDGPQRPPCAPAAFA